MKVIVITGASSGIGAELALKAAANGYSVAICARRKEKLEKMRTVLILCPVQKYVQSLPAVNV